MEERELQRHPEHELNELKNIYIQRGLQPALAQEVAQQLTAHNALDAHARDEIGISDHTSAQPFRAAFSSAIAFTVGSLFSFTSTFNNLYIKSLPIFLFPYLLFNFLNFKSKKKRYYFIYRLP